ncbi:MAG: urease subunit beta [Deltaproteobacteria bacterium]|jgi:urease subunit beta/urease subunit gamma/beta|nr:urease subunit beta [Deltaproteobacteria bacterium]MCL6119963.1 urease subunit beta [Deltaproteobacteria bacterium]
MVPGEYIFKDTSIEINKGRKIAKVIVSNTGDRPIQVGSHYHFFEVNKALDFYRLDGYGMRLNIPAGTAVRFEPGEYKEVELVDFGGNGIICGFNGLTNGSITDATVKKNAVKNAKKFKFKGI